MLGRLAPPFLPFIEFEIDPRPNTAWIGARDVKSVSQLAFDLTPQPACPVLAGAFHCEGPGTLLLFWWCRRTRMRPFGPGRALATPPNIKMLVSDWFTDELGNKARIIKARD